MEIHQYITDSNAKSTGYGTTTSINTLKRYLEATGVTHHLPEQLNPEELNTTLCNFYMNIKKTDGAEYEPDSLSTIHRGIARYFDSKNYVCNIITDERFSDTKRVLKAKRKRLRAQGLGNLLYVF